MYYTDCIGGSGWGCGDNQNGKEAVPKAEKLSAEETKGRDINYEQLKDRGKRSDSSSVKSSYHTSELQRWEPAPVVKEHPGSPGELGKAVHIPADQEGLMKEKFKLNQFNLLASDLISLNRSLTDVRLHG